MMVEKKLGAVLLSGLMIGPILGSGIVLLPPMVYETAGDWAILAWGLIMVVSFFFAFLFGQLSVQFPGDAGVANAVEYAFGIHIKRLTALFLIGAVCFGPVAVLTVAAKYIHPLHEIPLEIIEGGLLIVGTGLLLKNVTSVGRIAFVISTSVAGVLFVSSIYSLAMYPKRQLLETSFSLSNFGYSLLLLFWILVGWEIIGNYSAEIHHPAKTIPRAVMYSATTIMVVSLTVAAGIQWINPTAVGVEQVSVTMIILPLFGRLSVLFMSIITASLCMTTYMLVLGGVSRLIASQAEAHLFPAILGKRSTQQVPIAALLALVGIHSLVFAALALDWFTLEQIVAVANGFFLSNALCGLLAAIRIFPGRFMKIVATLLACMFVVILLFSSPIVLIVIGVLTIYFVWKQLTTQNTCSQMSMEVDFENGL